MTQVQPKTHSQASLQVPSTILSINSSARTAQSSTRMLSEELIEALNPNATVIERNVAEGVPFVDEDWVNANFTPDEDRTEEHRQKLSYSNSLVKELQEADTIVIGLPIYNFGIPASLKAWVDMIARARLTFKYTAHGPEGLLTGKRAFLVVASGGTPIGSDIDFATSYMRHALKFVGITDVTIIDAAESSKGSDTALARARQQVSQIAA